jgi:hypothetical protein
VPSTPSDGSGHAVRRPLECIAAASGGAVDWNVRIIRWQSGIVDPKVGREQLTNQGEPQNPRVDETLFVQKRIGGGGEAGIEDGRPALAFSILKGGKGRRRLGDALHGAGNRSVRHNVFTQNPEQTVSGNERASFNVVAVVIERIDSKAGRAWYGV